jgi:DNA polymerase-3 subunit gamma/tau
MKDAKNDFTQNDLVKYWIEYANSLTIEKIHLKNTLISCKPVLKDNYSFEISVYNPSQRDEIVDSNTQILGYLSNKLKNNQIKMDILIVEKGEIEKIGRASCRERV